MQSAQWKFIHHQAFIYNWHILRSWFLLQCLPRYADVVAVTMVDGGKYSLDLFEEGCRRVTPLNVQYKTEKETEWQATIKHGSKSCHKI